MKTNHKLAVAVLTGALIGFAGAKAIHAQQAKAPLGYIIYEADGLPDIPNLQKYAEKLPETLAPFNHRYIIRGKPEALEGEPPQSIVVIAFDSVEKAREWYDSPAYRAIRPIRQSASKGRLLIVEGVVPQ
jgi:uncharacterized protein (DUF1330 family)